MSTHHAAGFGMIDTLIGLMLLAVVLLGACSVLIQQMRAAQAAALQGRAVDLAADLTEDLRDITSPAAAAGLVQVWRERVSTALPVAGLLPGDFASAVVQPAVDGETPRLELAIQWRNAQAGTRSTLQLPAAIGFAEPLP